MNPARKVSHPTGAPVRLYLLGTFRLERDAKLVRLATHKVESLFAYLALFPQPHSREQLTALLWGESSDDQARHSLRTALSSIRQALDDEILLTDRESVQLNPDIAVWVDAAHFSRLQLPASSANESDLETLKASPETQADLMPDFYDEWILRERERLRLLYIDALLHLAQRHRETSECAEAVEFAQRVLARDRANEKAHQIVMFCLAAQGDRIAALKQYDECKKSLREELSVEPSPETIALREQIEQSLIGSLTEPLLLTNLPNPLTSFIGREKEIDELKRLFSNTRLLTLTGVGGSGKTRLTIQMARDALPHYKHGVWWVDLAPLSDAALVPQNVARVLGVQELGERTPVDMLRLFIRDKGMLLVLDNCEHLVGACAELAETLLLACPHLQILATSREALNVTGEMVWRVPSLAFPDPNHLPPLDQLAQYDAVKLFVQRAMASSQDWTLNDNASAVADICARLDGIPLAIELAAARVKLLKAERILERLTERFALLTGGSRTALPRQQTLRATLDWSHDLLPDSTRRLFRRLAVFAGGWILEAAEEVCADEHLSKTEVLNELSRLVDRSLVVVETQKEETRYRYLETIRQYAHEKLEAADEGGVTRTRHLDYFLRLAEEVEPKLHGPAQEEWLDRLELEHDNLRAALDWSLGEGRVEKGLRLVGALGWFWEMRAYLTESHERAGNLLNQPEAAPKTLARAKALLVTAIDVRWWYGLEAKDDQYLKEVIAIARAHGKAGQPMLALGLAYLGNNLFGNDPLAAESMVEEALSVAHAAQDEWILGSVLFLRGSLFVGRKDYPAARKAFQESLTRFRSLSDKFWEAYISFFVSVTHFRDGEIERARQEFETSLPILRQARHLGLLQWTLNALGIAAHAERHYDLARKYYEEALGIARDLGYTVGIEVCAGNLAFALIHQGELEAARSLFAESLPISRDLNDKSQLAFVLSGFASLAAMEKKAPRAVRLIAVADALLEDADKRSVAPTDEAEFKYVIALAREQMDETAFNAAWAEGRAMILEQAIEYALEKVT